MNALIAETPLLLTLSLIVVLVFALSIFTWIALIWRISMRTPILRCEPRRHVPWSGGDVLFLVVAYIFIQSAAGIILHHVDAQAASGPKAVSCDPADCNATNAVLKAEVNDEDKIAHPLLRLFNSNNAFFIALGVFMAVVEAPLIEEFIFRVTLQGWLESAWIRGRRKRRGLAESTDRMVRDSFLARLRKNKITRMAAIFPPAIIFAMLHFHRANEPEPSTQVAGATMARLVADGLWIVLALYLMMGVRGATARDLGWNLRHIFYDATIGLVASLAVVPPLLLFNGLLANLFVHYHVPFAPDPLALFPLALALGFVYQRTHRITPSLFLHVGLNSTSVMWLFVLKAIGH